MADQAKIIARAIRNSADTPVRRCSENVSEDRSNGIPMIADTPTRRYADTLDKAATNG